MDGQRVVMIPTLSLLSRQWARLGGRRRKPDRPSFFMKDVRIWVGGGGALMEADET